MQRFKWLERSFSLDQPVEMFPMILERLRGTAARIEEMTTGLSPEKLVQKKGTAWSIQEHVGHLIDLDELHDGRIDDYLEQKPVLRAADMANKKTYAANHNNTDLKKLIAGFRQERNHFIERLLKLDPGQVSLHPRLQQPMKVVDMAFFVAEHDDQHLAIMRELIEGK